MFDYVSSTLYKLSIKLESERPGEQSLPACLHAHGEADQ